MKKLFSLLLVCCLAISATACSDKKETNASAPDEMSTSKSDKTADSKEEHEDKSDRVIDTDNQYVFDESEILSNAEFDELNSYTAWIAKTYKINASVVLTDDIGESEPEDYAKNYYESNYSGDGILFLVNNDTNNDYLYRHGIPSKFISNSDVQMLFSEISPMLALEDYSAAISRVLEEAELRLPKYFTDRTGTLKAEEIAEYNDYISDNAGQNNINVYYVIGTGEQEIKDFADERFKMFYDRSENNAMLVINGENGESFLSVSGKLNYLLESRTAIEEAVKSCFDETDGMDLENAVKKFIGFVE